MIGPLIVVLSYIGMYITCGLPDFTVRLTWPKILWEVTKRILAYAVCGFILIALYFGVIVQWL